jgi:hypothetical protein
MNPFDFVKSINTSKENLIEEDPENEKEYNAYLINRALSYYRDTVFHANEMNKSSVLPNKLQYEFYLYSVPKGKRFAKWEKKTQNDEIIIEHIMKEYFFSRKRAEEALSLLSPDQKSFIVTRYSIGGKNQ